MPGINSTADSTAAPFDPYELKDVVGGTIRNPYPAMHALCRESPVHVGPIDLGEGAETPDPTKPAPVTVFGFDEVVQVLRDSETYSSTIYEEIMGMVMGRTILQMDEPEHRTIRTLVASSFRSKMLERWEEDLVALVVNELIDTFIDEGRTDLVRSVTFNFPVQVIARILGLPREDYPKFQRWALELTSVAANWERGIAASAALRDYFADVMAERRAAPGDDLISDLVRAEVEGKRLNDEEIFSFLRLLLPAGVETTYRASGSMLFALLEDRDQFDALYADRSLFPQAFEEVVRWEPPVTVILRRATRDAELAGVAIEEGADIALLIGAANRDERKYPDPDRYDMFREQRQHVGFGFGVHVCLGMHLARMESRIADQHPARPPRALRVGPGGRAAAHRGSGLPLAALPAGGLPRRGVVSGAWAGEPTRCRTQRPSWASGRPSSPSTSTGPRASWPPRRWWPRCVTPASPPPRSTACPRSPWRRPTRSPWPRRSGRGTSPTSPRWASAVAPAAPPSATPPWPSPPARPTWWWPGARASGATGPLGPGRPRRRASRSRRSGRGPSACCARWTRWPCWPAATCTSTGPAARTWPRWPWRCGPTPTGTRPR